MTVKQAIPTFVDLLRHGEPRGGQKYRGQLDDPLSALGWSQMRSAVRDEAPWDVIVTSPLSRCRAFAEVLAAERDLPLHVAPEFMEMNFGQWEGLTPDQVLAEYGDLLPAFWKDAVNNTPPGAEPMTDFFERVGKAWDHWTDRLWGRRILLVCHGGIIRMAVAHALGMPPASVMAKLHVPYASRSQIRLDRTDHGLLSCLTEHGVR